MKRFIQIFQYWWHFVTLPDYVFYPPYTQNSMWSTKEGLLQYSGLNYMTFWYFVNLEWYQMQNIKFADIKCDLPYSDPCDEIFEE